MSNTASGEKYFLHCMAEKIFRSYGDSLGDLCIVFPGRRAGLYFLQHLAGMTDQPTWAPQVFTITEFMLKFSDLQAADQMKLVFDLYESYCTEIKTTGSFDDFYSWGIMLLNDFDEIDKYLADAQSLYSNMASLKNMDDMQAYLTPEQIEAIRCFWSSFEPGKWTGNQEQFISVWEKLYPVYTRFREQLRSRSLGYEGMIFRDVAEKTEKNEFPEIPWKKVVFACFNALNRCEEKVFRYFLKAGLAEFYWDYDHHYLDNKDHEAGKFMRTNIRSFPPSPLDCTFDNLCSGKCEIEFISVPSDMNQAVVAGSILEKSGLTEKTDCHHTAVILPDEHVLLPVLYSIPHKIEHVNVTMGYPLKNTPVYSLVSTIIELQKNIRPAQDDPDQFFFYFRDVLAILNHQYINHPGCTEASGLAAFIHANNRIYLDPAELQRQGLMAKIFRIVKNITEMPDYLMDILYQIYKEKEQGTALAVRLEQEYIYQLYISVKRLGELISQHKNLQTGKDTFLRLLKQIIQNIRIPFSGEPLAGLQVMGALETRGLDFEQVIILSMNEGVFPFPGRTSSFIPYNLRKGFGLPVFEDQEALYSYYFYRLLQRAKKVFLVCNSENDGMKTGEMSRYIYQLKYDPAFTIKESFLAFDLSVHQPVPLLIKKTPPVMKKLNPYFLRGGGEKYLSPSALNSYIDCSLRFYFRYVAGLEEPEKAEEEIDAAYFGIFLHSAMNLIYRPYLNNVMTAETLDSIKKHNSLVDDAIIHVFRKDYFRMEDNLAKVNITGKNTLIYEILKKYILQIIEIDKQYTPLHIIALEKPFRMSFPVKIGNKDFFVNMGGTIDRIDKTGDSLRIIDYKTGPVDKKFGGITSLFNRGDKKRNRAVFQSLFYSLLTAKTMKSEKHILPGLYFIKESFLDDHDFYIEDTSVEKKMIHDFSEYAATFEEELMSLITGMINTTESFSQVENEDLCVYCPYKGICHRG